MKKQTKIAAWRYLVEESQDGTSWKPHPNLQLFKYKANAQSSIRYNRRNVAWKYRVSKVKLSTKP